VKFDNISSNEKINEWINKSYQECRASYPLPERGRFAFDIGANVGGFCIHAHKNFDKIFAFEPMLENYNILCKTIETLGIKNVEIFNTAVYSESNRILPLGVYEYNSDKIHSRDVSIVNNSGNISCVENSKKNLIEIDQQCETISIKDAMNALSVDKIDYLKLDCEGSEYPILENFNDYDKISWICMEIHKIYGNKRKEKLLKMMQKFYYLTDINKAGHFSIKDVIDNQLDNNFEKYDNVLMINKNLFDGVKK